MKVALINNNGSCRKCPCVNDTGSACKLAKRPFSEGMKIQIKHGEKAVPIWCPLSDLPEALMDWYDDGNSYEAGWNAAIRQIGGLV